MYPKNVHYKFNTNTMPLKSISLHLVQSFLRSFKLHHEEAVADRRIIRTLPLKTLKDYFHTFCHFKHGKYVFKHYLFIHTNSNFLAFLETI